MRWFYHSILVFFTFLLFYPATNCNAAPPAKWTNPCSASKALDGDDPCTFLIDTYAQIDERCGFTFGRAWYKPWQWFSPTEPWDVIPNGVLLDMPLQPADMDKAQWQRLNLPSLARLMTLAFPDPPGVALKNTEILSNNLVGLHFNPLLPPEIMFDKGKANYVRSLTCTNALTATQNGKVNVSLASVAEKFSSQENDSSSAKLAYGTFESPLAYDRRQYPDRFRFEALAFYEDYLRMNGPPSGGWPNFRYVSNVEGLVVYDTVKGSLSTDLSANASANYSVPLGSVDGSVDGTRTIGDTTNANLFFALVRNAMSISQLPLPADVISWLNGADWKVWAQSKSFNAGDVVLDAGNHAYKTTGACTSGASMPAWNDSGSNITDGTCTWQDSGPVAASSLIRLDNSFSKTAAWNATAHDVEATFVIEGMPSSLCKEGVWQITAPNSFSASLSAPTYHSAASLRTTSSGTSTTSNVPSACAWTINTTKADGTNPIVGSLQFADSSLNVQLPFSIPYVVNAPQLQFVSADPPSANSAGLISEGFWYQVVSPSLLDTTQTITIDKSSTFSCPAITLPADTIRTATVAESYPTGGLSISGTYLHVQLQWTKTSTPATACSANGKVNVVTKSGAPVTVSLLGG